jgi:uncharacterized protein YecE (DUF72 family)
LNLYVGTSGYSYPAWKGSFYPRDLPAKQMLGFYGEHLSAVESNYTFRSVPTPAVLAAWMDAVPTAFKFALKAPQQVTHIKRLKDVAEPVARFLDVARGLKRRLGPLLFQLPPNLKKDVARLRDLLALVPRRRAALEFRHPSWFDDEVFRLLRKRGAALCIADTGNGLDVPFVATADWGYLRLRGTGYSTKKLKVWLKRIREQNWREVYAFFKHEDEGNGPGLARRLLELAGELLHPRYARSTARRVS